MTRSRSVEAELGALRAEMEQAASRRADPPEAPTPENEPPRNATEPPAGDFSATLEDFKRLLGDYADSAEELAADHPLAVAGAAFLLGFSLGRLSK